MEITKGKTINGYVCIKFQDDSDIECQITVRKERVIMKVDYADFTQEQIKELLPYLQSFAETGTLEPQESPLQGVGHALEQLSNFEEGIQKAQRQETKDSLLCWTVAVLSRFAPLEVKEKALHLLAVYNEDERIPPSLLQGEDQTKLALQLMATQKEQEERIESLRKELEGDLAQAVENIKALEQLVKDWRYALQICPSNSHLNNLQERTNQLLGEE